MIGFKESFDQNGINTELCLSGNVRDANPDRIILKRVILSGIPFKHAQAQVRGEIHVP